MGYKHCLVLDPAQANASQTLRRWLAQVQAKTLNVAGPRASQWSDGHMKAVGLLNAALAG